jgi:hypothetical protein
MRRDAGAEVEADAEQVVARAGGAVLAALLQAADSRVAVVPAAVALQQVSSDGPGGADLRRCERSRGVREARIGDGEAGVVRDRRNRDERADARPTLLVPFDPFQSL